MLINFSIIYKLNFYDNLMATHLKLIFKLQTTVPQTLLKTRSFNYFEFIRKREDNNKKYDKRRTKARNSILEIEANVVLERVGKKFIIALIYMVCDRRKWSEFHLCNESNELFSW